MLGARERDENRTRPGIRGTWHEKTDVARGCGEHRLNHRVIEERVWRFDEEQVDVLLGGDANEVRAGSLGRESSGPRGHAARPQRLTPLARESTRFGKIGGGSDQLGQDELAHGATCQRLSDRKEIVETGRVEGRHQDRTFRRCERLDVERGVVPKDRALELLQRWGRLEAELVDEPRACTSIHAECVRLAAAPVQGEHQLPRGRLAKRMLYRERLQLRDHLAVPTEREIGLDTPLQRDEAKLLEPCDRRLREILVRKLLQRRSAPKRESFSKRWRLRRPGPSRAESATSRSKRRRSSWSSSSCRA